MPKSNVCKAHSNKSYKSFSSILSFIILELEYPTLLSATASTLRKQKVNPNKN